MANYVVWMDQEHANIFELHPNEVKETHMKRHEIRQHTGAEKEQNRRKNTDKFFGDVAQHLTGAHEILLLGPGLAKEHFKSHLESHHQELLGKKIVGVETVDHPTDGQIVALAKKFFKAHLSA